MMGFVVMTRLIKANAHFILFASHCLDGMGSLPRQRKAKIKTSVHAHACTIHFIFAKITVVVTVRNEACIIQNRAWVFHITTARILCYSVFQALWGRYRYIF
uniref:Uncharacterized protein n=1 Tax=Ditylum brightwellii TaxID=49249 RepID=A0A6U3Z7B5_9STRA